MPGALLRALLGAMLGASPGHRALAASRAFWEALLFRSTALCRSRSNRRLMSPWAVGSNFDLTVGHTSANSWGVTPMSRASRSGS